MKRTLPENFEKNDDNKRTKTIFKLVKSGDCEGVKSLLDAGADVNDTADNTKKTLLSLACKHLNIEMIELLLDRGADVNQKDSRKNMQWNNTPVAEAVRGYMRGTPGYFEPKLMCLASKAMNLIKLNNILVLLKQHGANFDVEPDVVEESPLLSAVDQCDLELVNLLLDLGAGPNVRLDYDDENEFSCGADTLYALMKLLLEKGADPTIDYNIGLGALHLCLAKLENEGVDYDSIYALMKLLLEKGADPNLQQAHGLTPLNLFMHIRPRNKDNIHQFCTLLFEYKADPHIADNIGNIPLRYALQFEVHREIIEMLFGKLDKDSINLQNNNEETLLHCCAGMPRTHKYIKPLLTKGADPNIKDSEFAGYNPFELYMNERSSVKDQYWNDQAQIEFAVITNSFIIRGATWNVMVSLGVRDLAELENIISETDQLRAIKEMARYVCIFKCISKCGLNLLPIELQLMVAGYCYFSETNEIFKICMKQFQQADITISEQAENAYRESCLLPSFVQQNCKPLSTALSTAIFREL